MKNKFREKLISRTEERFFRKVGRKGFALEESRVEGLWNILKFSTNISYDVPEVVDRFSKNGRRPTERSLVLWTRPNSLRLGVNVSFTSGGQPENRKRYHFMTNGPVSGAKALRLIDGYLGATREGRSYNPSR